MKTIEQKEQVVESWFINHYTCPRCDTHWQDEWYCMVDDECPQCLMRNISPHRSEDVSVEDPYAA